MPSCKENIVHCRFKSSSVSVFAWFKRWGSAHSVLGQFRFFDRVTSAVNIALKMGASHDKPLKCPLCYQECREQVTLACTHSFCRVCISELWSGSQTGPYFCPECRYEYQHLPDYTDGASTSSATRTFNNTKINVDFVDLEHVYVIIILHMCMLLLYCTCVVTTAYACDVTLVGHKYSCVLICCSG